ncbi:MAG: hypothetical protein PUC94_02235 [Bacteroidales bacterium]|nr:hypothetical protein [Bacteroidales bacterium]
MTKYTGKTSVVNLPAAEISDKFADMSTFNDKLAGMPEDVRKHMGDLTFTRDSVCMDTKQAGKVVFKVTERDDRHIVLACSFPLPISLTLNLSPVADDAAKTEMSTDVDIEIPAMLRPIIGPQMQKVADHFSTAMGSIASL